MNKERRKELEKILDAIEKTSVTLQDAKERLDNLYHELENIKDDEQNYLDNMPESLQGSDKYENSEEIIIAIEELMNHMQEIDNVDMRLDVDPILNVL